LKLMIYIIIFLASLSIVFSAEGDEIPGVPPKCATALLCGGYESTCNPYSSDGVCPEDYGDWSSCQDNNYGKCFPCDPDCGDCGYEVEIDVPNANNPGYSIEIKVNAYGYPGTNRFQLYKLTENGQQQLQGVNVSCIGEDDDSICSHTFNVNIQGNYCGKYTFGTDFYEHSEGGNNYNLVGSVQDDGIILPSVSIINPGGGFAGDNPEDLSGNIDLISNVECSIENNPQEGRVWAVIYYLCNRDDEVGCPLGRFATIRTNDNNEEAEGTYTYELDTTRFLNDNYRIDSRVVASRDEVVDGALTERTIVDSWDSIDIILNNQAGIGSTYQGSKILNIVIARLKTWL